MGQYRQWLQFREIDQQLRAQQAELEQELADLVGQLHQLEDATSLTENSIIQALSKAQQVEETFTTIADTPLVPIETTNDAHTDTKKPPETVSAALFGWSRLPNFDVQRIEAQSIPSTSLPLSATPEPGLLPDDIPAFMAEHTNRHTAPQLELPWWFSQALTNSEGPIDQQSTRTNYLIQRWFERWGRQPKEVEKTEEGQHS